MNIKYTHEFKGLDEVSNRFEILTDGEFTSKELVCSSDAFVLEYLNTKKLDTVRGAQATLRLISEQIFQYVDLHTDDMQSHMVKFYRDNILTWVGWLDSELYTETLSDTPPYVVEFSAADFNIWERLKYRDSEEKNYTDIVPMITHLRRCFDKLGIPFNNLYIGCSTTSENINLGSSETILHKLYIQSSNFYDEDGEPMTCREVVDSILKPFGLSLVQYGGDVYIYDLNTIYTNYSELVLMTYGKLFAHNGKVISFKSVSSTSFLKKYKFSDFSYLSDSIQDFGLAKLDRSSFMGTSGDYGFEEMINNVTITSSPYIVSFFKEEIEQESLSENSSTNDYDKYSVETYDNDKNYEPLNGTKFKVFTNKENDNTLIGAVIDYDADQTTIISAVPLLRVASKGVLLASENSYYLKVKVGAYVSTKENPFDDETTAETDSRAKGFYLRCNLIIKDVDGNPVLFCHNQGAMPMGWLPYSQFTPGALILFFSDKDIAGSQVLNKNLINNDVWTTATLTGGFAPEIKEKSYQTGLNVRLNPDVSGRIIFEVTDINWISNPQGYDPYPKDKVKFILLNDFSLSIKNSNKEDVSTDDYEFKSYINKKVSSDLDEVTLNCISANEDQVPTGRGNILVKDSGKYKIQNSFTRNNQTNILERLLMITIHSNYTRKNQMFSSDVKMDIVNSPLGNILYPGILNGQFLLTGCTYDYANASTTINVVEYSKDTDNLTDIPYE